MQLEVKKSDMFKIPVSFIQANHEENGRFAPGGDVAGLANSIKSHGQKQPVGVKRLKGDDFKLVYGFRRYEAFKLLNAELPEDQQIPINAVIVRENEQEQFLSNLTENFERAELTPMDYAVNIRRLTETWGKTRQEVAEFYRKSIAWVGQHLQLLDLTFDAQQQVHNGLISFADAREMAAKADYDAQREVVAAINAAALQAEAEIEAVNPTTETESEKVAEVKAKTVKRAAKNAGKQAVAKAVNKPYVTPPSKREPKKMDELGKRTYAEMREFIELHMDSNQFSKEVRTVAAILLKGMEGKIRDDMEFSNLFVNAIDRKTSVAYVAN